MDFSSTLLSSRAAPITADDKSTAITISTLLTMIILIIMFLARQAIKFVVLRKFQADDVLIFIATICAVGYSTTNLILARDGLGVQEALTLRRADNLMKAYYASDYLYILTLCFAKLSLIAWFYGLNVQTTVRKIIQAFGIFILAWTASSLIAVAFQCGLPKPWEMMTLHCYNSGIFWIVFCIIDMTSEVGIVMLSVNLVAYLKIKFSRKFAVVACFAPRLLVIGAALARLVYLFPITPHDNPAFNLWTPVICTQVQVCLAISTACIPYMKPFFEGVEAGVWRADNLRRMRVGGHGSGYRKAKGRETLSAATVASTTILNFGRTPDESPRIPSPAPLSPMHVTPPRFGTPPNSAKSNSRSPSERGLKLHIPPANTRPINRVTSPQTASSTALSPECVSPQHPLLAANQYSPSVPPRAHSPRPQASSSYYGSPDINVFTLPDASVSPATTSKSPRPPSVQYSPFPQTFKTPPPRIPPVSIPQRNNKNQRSSVQRLPANIAATRFPVRTTSLPQGDQPAPRPQVKFSTTPKTATSSAGSTIPSYYMHSPLTQRSSQASTPGVPSYYTMTPPIPEIATFPTPPSPYRVRNQRILSPQNSSRRDQINSASPTSPLTPLTFWRSESSAAGESAGTSAGPSWDREEAEAHWPPPVMRDARSSPRIVIQHS